jgi:hypothetical protein
LEEIILTSTKIRKSDFAFHKPAMEVILHDKDKLHRGRQMARLIDLKVIDRELCNKTSGTYLLWVDDELYKVGATNQTLSQRWQTGILGRFTADPSITDLAIHISLAELLLAGAKKIELYFNQMGSVSTPVQGISETQYIETRVIAETQEKLILKEILSRGFKVPKYNKNEEKEAWPSWIGDLKGAISQSKGNKEAKNKLFIETHMKLTGEYYDWSL